MFPSFLFLLYLLSNTVLLGTESSAGERGKVLTMMRREYITQPSFLPAVDSPLWDMFPSVLFACCQKGNCVSMHTRTEEYTPQ